MSRRVALVAATVVAAGLLSSVSSTASAGTGSTVPPPPDTTVAIPLGSVSDMVVDDAAGRVFYAGTAPSLAPTNGHGGGVAYSNLDGTGMANIHGTTSTTRLTLGPDGMIYALESRGVVTVIDPSTLSTASHALPATVGCPTSVAVAGGQVWVSYRCVGGQQGLAAFDLATETATDYPLAHTSYGAPLIRSVPNHPNLLVGSSLTGAGQLSLIDVSGATPGVLAQTESLLGSPESGPIPFVVTSDGSTILAASVGQDGVGSFSTADLAAGAVYHSPLANVVTDNGDGTNIAAASTFDCSVSTFINTAIAPVRTYLSGLDAKPKEQGCPTSLAWAGSSVLAVYTGTGLGWPLLHVLNGPMQAPTTLQFSGPSAVGRATPLTVTGQLVGLPNTPVIITKRDLAGAHTLATVTTDADGRFSLADLPRVGGSNIYVARYLGDPTHGGVATAAVVNVSRGTVPLTVRIDRSTYNFHDIAHVSIHLASHDVKKVQLWVKPSGYFPKYQTTLTVDAHGNAQYAYRVAYNTDFIVKFYGDYYYNPRAVGVIGGTRVLVTQRVSGNYTMSGQYLEFCCNAEVNGSVAPVKWDTHVGFEVQRFLLGRWISAPAPSGYDVTLNGDGSVRAFFMRSRLGYYRIRTVYHTDYENIGNVSSWAYIKFPGWNP